MRLAFVISGIGVLAAVIAFASSPDSARAGHAEHASSAPASASRGDARTGKAAEGSLEVAPTPVIRPHSGHGEKPAPNAVDCIQHSPPAGSTVPAKQMGPREEPRVPLDVTPKQQMRIGLATKAAVTERVHHSFRVVGSVVADQRRETHVHTRVAGWIDDISVSAVGAEVKRGQVLYRLYAPELMATQQELIASRRQGELGKRLAAAALDRLSLWGVAPSEIEALANGAEPKRALAFLAPTSGYVIDKIAVRGAYVTPEMELYRIADLSKVWIVVSLYENELPLVAIGDVAEVTLSGALDSNMDAERASISFIYPELDMATRTGRARIEIENKGLVFKPGMYANVSIEKDLGTAVVVPEDALIFTGQRNLVFRKTSATRFVPIEVNVGPRVKGGRVVLAGIGAGDEVVVRAGFLIDAESRLQAALEKGGGGSQGHAGHGG
jgi:Cu(I)/Ag(I) efflux system membrane fusion protein